MSREISKGSSYSIRMFRIQNPSSQTMIDGNIWRQYRRSATLFALIIFILGCAGSFLLSSKYRATAILSMDEKGGSSHWQALAEDVRKMDFEDQIQSRAVLEPVLDLAPKRAKRSWVSKLKDLIAHEQTPEQRAATALQSFQKKIKVNRSQQSSVISIQVKDKDPLLAAKYANAIAQSFIDYRRKESTGHVEQLIRSIERETEVIHEQLQQKTEERNKFLEENGWDDFELELQNASQKVANIKDMMNSVAAYHGVRENSQKGAEETTPKALELPKDANATLLDVARRYATADNELGRMGGVYRQEYPGVLQAKLEKEMMETLLKDQLRNPEARRELLEKQLLQEQMNLHQLLRQAPQAQILGSSIEYSQQRYLELMDQKAKARFLLTRWAEQPSDTFDGIYLLDKALPPPSRSLAEILIRVLLTGFLLSVLGFFTLPLVLSLWNAELSRLLTGNDYELEGTQSHLTPHEVAIPSDLEDDPKNHGTYIS